MDTSSTSLSFGNPPICELLPFSYSQAHHLMRSLSKMKDPFGYEHTFLWELRYMKHVD